jgi:hypothetical protein
MPWFWAYCSKGWDCGKTAGRITHEASRSISVSSSNRMGIWRRCSSCVI